MDSHVIPGLIYRMNLSKSRNEDVFKIWGTGSPLREFLYSEDLADFIEFIIDKDLNYDLINVGSGVEISIKEFAEKIKQIIKYEGQLSLTAQNLTETLENYLIILSQLKLVGSIRLV